MKSDLGCNGKRLWGQTHYIDLKVKVEYVPWMIAVEISFSCDFLFCRLCIDLTGAIVDSK